MSESVFATAVDLSGLRDRVALVTGGASGLGRATVLALAEAGCEVVVADVSVEAGEAIAADVDGRFVRADVSSLDANLGMAEFAVRECGGLDFAFLNAGISTGCGVGEDFSLASYRRAMGVNLDGVVFGTHACLPALRASAAAGRGGAIVATASLAGLTGMAMDPIYTANKHGVVGLARSLGPGLLASDGVRFNAVCPGFAESQIIVPLREMLEAEGFEIIPAESVAETVVRLFALDVTGECWFVQPRREPSAFRFRGVPGPGERV